MIHPLFEIVTTKMGAVSIRNKAVNEIMHNPVGPWIEANALYIEQSGLEAMLTEGSEELVIFDVGLGAAANALAALACVGRVGAQARPVRMISFERDLELLRFAAQHSSQFSHFQGYEQALEDILLRGSWSGGKVSWELRHGEFPDLIERESHKAHLIFFDPYSPKVNQEMWTTACFEKLRRKSREPADGGTLLYTYSRATRVRVALMRAGFQVGSGSATGMKSETTVAATDVRKLKAPLGKKWFETWKKSHERYPFDCADHERAAMDEFIERRYFGECSE